MLKKHKMTGCARLFFALLIIAPLAYFAASYYNGQNPIQNIKNFLGIGAPKDQADDTYDVTKPQEALSDKDREIQKLKDENAELRKEIKTLKEEIDRLKNQ